MTYEMDAVTAVCDQRRPPCRGGAGKWYGVVIGALLVAVIEIH